MFINELCAQYPDLVEQLQALPPQLLESSIPVKFIPGQQVVSKDEPVKYVYYILSGELLVYNETMDGKFSTWLTKQAPTIISDLEILSGFDTYAANVSASTNCSALRFSASHFSSQLKSDVNFLWSIASMTTRENFILSRNRGDFAFRSNIDKTALFLLQQYILSPPPDGSVYILRKTRLRIASELIVSLKTVDRCLMHLRSENYISIIKGKVHISASQHQRLLENWGSAR